MTERSDMTGCSGVIAPPDDQPPARRVHDDAAVIATSLADPAAFGLLFERHQAVVRRYAISRLGADAADDLVADAFVDAFDARHRFDPQVSRDALPWLLGVATNCMRRHRRAERRWLESLDAARAFPRQDDVHGGARLDALDAARRAPLLRATLQTLRRRDRDAFVLFAVCDMPLHDIARALGVPVGTIKSRLHRARRLLAAALRDHEAQP